MNKRVDSNGELMEKLLNRANRVRAENLLIIGGEFSVNLLNDFLNEWPLHIMPYRIWDSFDQVKFEKKTLQDIELLERGRIFGEAGDLDIRRDGNRFLWRFVGEPNHANKIDVETHNFWDEQHEIKYLHCSEEKVLLWGKFDVELARWYDNRVGNAILVYPMERNTKRVMLVLNQYSYAGQVQFVQFKEVKGVEEW